VPARNPTSPAPRTQEKEKVIAFAFAKEPFSCPIQIYDADLLETTQMLPRTRNKEEDWTNINEPIASRGQIRVSPVGHEITYIARIYINLQVLYRMV
jgi:hypothetical protein